MIIGIIMAGGKGKRMNILIEKPLINLIDKPLIEHVLDNMKCSQYVEKIAIAVSPHTKKTKEYLEEKLFNNIDKKIDSGNKSNFDIIDTPGNGYLEDLSFLLSHFENESKDNVLVFINSDLPFIFFGIIDNVIEKYLKCDKESISVSVPISLLDNLGIKPSYVFDGLIPSGLNILISENKTQNEEKVIIPKIELALNINTIDDVELANYLFKNNQIHNI